jgi:O-antigen biosynthesis rhamnosyltransferase
MRVLHFYKNALPESIGGVEQAIDQIVRGTSALGVKGSVLTLSKSPTNTCTLFHGYELFSAKRNFEIASSGFSWHAVSLFKNLAAKADLIHYHYPWPFADLVHQLVLPNKPTVLTYHSDIIRQRLLLYIYQPLRKSFLNTVDHIVATSPNYLKTSNVLQTLNYKTSVIPIGLNEETYPKTNARLLEYYKERFGLRFFLFIGAFRYYKGLQFLIEAAKEAPYPIVLVGSGPIENEFKAYIQLQHIKNIFFVGQVDEENKSALLEACYGVIFPSNLRSEAFGVTLLEGAMFSKPLISCEIGTGTSYINIDQETGLVVPPSDEKALANAMISLWTNPEKAKEMGRRARARYETLFTARQMSQSYYELYQKMLIAK